MHKLKEKTLAKFDHAAAKVHRGLGRLEESVGLDVDRDGHVGVRPCQYDCADLQRMTEDELDAVFNAIEYDQLAADIGTGDILLLHGTETFSALIKSATQSWYSHAAVVLREVPSDILQLYGSQPAPDGLYVFESDTETVDGREGGGVQLLPLRHWVLDAKSYYSRFFFLCHRSLRTGDGDGGDGGGAGAGSGAGGSGLRTVDAYPGLIQCLRSAHGRLYEHRKPELVKSVVQGNSDQDLTTIFCSELVAWVLREMGILPRSTNPSNWVPRMFSGIHEDRVNRELCSGVGKFEMDRRIKV
eukprot:NODE_2375_length_1215_cov_134.885077_g2167_i0.p1 GENE.NODE_2375_length_1215_cov_134.885077_g2167_i0~~NODE_2375_length_1215_cov_134.885077_g2167_i0.p1  ORF type:complete len:300 (-),score=44.85 NODE_2375_length_1215_cov_134.885077_g2167_i0:168-1067(-)